MPSMWEVLSEILSYTLENAVRCIIAAAVVAIPVIFAYRRHLLWSMTVSVLLGGLPFLGFLSPQLGDKIEPFDVVCSGIGGILFFFTVSLTVYLFVKRKKQ